MPLIRISLAQNELVGVRRGVLGVHAVGFGHEEHNVNVSVRVRGTQGAHAPPECPFSRLCTGQVAAQVVSRGVRARNNTRMHKK